MHQSLAESIAIYPLVLCLGSVVSRQLHSLKMHDGEDFVAQAYDTLFM